VTLPEEGARACAGISFPTLTLLGFVDFHPPRGPFSGDFFLVIN